MICAATLELDNLITFTGDFIRFELEHVALTFVVASMRTRALRTASYLLLLLLEGLLQGPPVLPALAPASVLMPIPLAAFPMRRRR